MIKIKNKKQINKKWISKYKLVMSVGIADSDAVIKESIN